MRAITFGFLTISLGACSASRAPEPTAPPHVVASAALVAVVSAPLPSASALPVVAPAPEGPKSCPDDMALVDGDYCTDVEQTCEKQWFAKANNKHVCELFEPNSKCVGSKIHKRYCMDKYEWPNKAGERPEVMNRFHQAEVKCAAVGKRMCSESEWTLACEGPDMKPFPYGYERDPLKCNGDNLWDNPNMKLVEKRDATELARLWRGVRSGSQPECVSDYGIFDLPGNCDEVSMSEKTPHGWPKFDSINTGGPWYSGVRNQCRPKIYTHGEDFYYYFLSFRCCSETDGKDTNPLTLRQQEQGWTMAKVEHSAQFTVADMQEKLKEKAAGTCDCSNEKGHEKQVLCKTMCGSLLGPDAEDVTKDTPRVRYAGESEKGNLKQEMTNSDKPKPKKKKKKGDGDATGGQGPE